MPEINTWDQGPEWIHTLSHFHTAAPIAGLLCLTLNFRGDERVNAATTELIYAERTIRGLRVSVILSGAAGKHANNQSQTCCFTPAPGRTPGPRWYLLSRGSWDDGWGRRARAVWIRIICVCVTFKCLWLGQHSGSPQFPEALSMGRLQVVLLSKAGEGPPDPLGGGTVLIMAPCGPRQKSQVGITVCSFVAGGASEAGSGLRAQWLLPAPQQASCLFALEIVLSQVTVKVVPGMMYCTVIGCFLTVVSGVGDVAVKGLQSVTVRNITVGMTHGLRSRRGGPGPGIHEQCVFRCGGFLRVYITAAYIMLT